MKTIQKLFLLLIMVVPITVLGQDVTYTFDSGGNGEYNTGTTTWTNLTVAGGTATTTNAPGLTLYDNGVQNSTYVLKSTGTSSPNNGCTVTFDAFASTTNQQVVYKEYVNSVTFVNKSGVVLRAQGSSAYGTGLKQGYFFRTTRAAGSGSNMGAVTFTIYRLESTATATSLAASSATTITGYTLGSALYIKATAIGSTLTMYYSLNGTSWTQAVQKTSETTYSTAGGVQAYWGMGVSGVQPVFLDDVQYWDLSKNVTLTGSKFIYDGTSKSPTISKTGFTSPTETITYTGISGTSYGPSSTAPTATGTYYMTVSEVESGVTRTANQVFSIISSTAFDKIYTFESDVVGSAAANTTASTGANVSAGHTVQLFTGATEGGYSVSTKTLSPNTTMTNGREISSLDYFGTTSTDYSVTWKEYNTSATANKHIVVLRADPTTSNSSFSATPNYRPQGQGYGFLVNPTGASALTVNIYKLNTSDAFTSLATASFTSFSVQGVPLWFRASAIGSSSVALKLEYSTDGTTWNTATTYTDSSSPVASGATHIFGVNSNNQNYYFDYFGLIDLTKNVTADDNKFIYTGSALTPTLSYPGFTTPNATLTYTGTGATSYASSSTAPTAVGTYSLVVSATESGATRTGTFGFEIVPNTYDNIYTFKTDGIGNTPAGISFAQGATSGTGVVASYSGTDNGSSATALTFRPTGLGTVGNTGVADLTSIASSSSYSVTWKEYVSGNGYKKGFLLQGQASTNGYANDLKQGYLFVVYNDATNGTKCRIYTVTSNTTLTSTDNANGSVANPASGVARWYRATVGYGLQKFEYSDNGTTWITANSTSDLTYAGLSGSTQAVYGFGAGVGNYYYDYIAAKAYTPVTATGGDWSAVLASSTPNSNITISSGELVVDDNKQVASLVIAPGAILTIASGKTLTADVINLQSDANNTATFVNNGTATITRGTVQQHLTAGRNWYIGSPVVGATASVFNPGGSANTGTGTTKVYWYDEANGSTTPWPQITSNSTSLVSMRGYIVNLAHDSTIIFSGVINDGEKSITVNRTVGQAKEGFNLVTNPYPSYLDWDNVTLTNLQTSFWQRSKNGSDTYVFDTYNSSGQMAVDNSGKGTNKHIPPMQAFWVRVNSGQATGTLTVNNTNRSHKGSAVIGTSETIIDPMFKVKTATTNQQKVVRLQISNDINKDETVIYTNDNANNSLDAYDSEKMFNNSTLIPELFTVSDGATLAINGLNTITPDTEMPIGFKVNAAGTYTISASLFNNFEAGTHLILIDNQTQYLTNLSDGNSYTFSTSAPESAESRFSIIFRSPSVTTNIDADYSSKVWISVNANNQLILNGSPLAGSSLDIYNLIGMRIATKVLNENANLSDLKLVSGIYTISINHNGYTSTQKIILK